MKSFWIVLGTLFVLIGAAMGFALSGIYNVSARVTHFALTSMLLETVREHSITSHSSQIKLPPLTSELAQKGAMHFDGTCVKCHGAPGQPQEEFAQGLYPAPPSLETVMNELSKEEIFWVINNGLKMTGMPAFGINHEREEIVGMTAFIEKLSTLDDQQYRKFVEETREVETGKGHHHHENSPHRIPPSEDHHHGNEDDLHHH